MKTNNYLTILYNVAHFGNVDALEYMLSDEMLKKENVHLNRNVISYILISATRQDRYSGIPVLEYMFKKYKYPLLDINYYKIKEDTDQVDPDDPDNVIPTFQTVYSISTDETKKYLLKKFKRNIDTRDFRSLLDEYKSGLLSNKLKDSNIINNINLFI